MRRRLASSTSTSITIQRITIVTLVAGWQKAPRHEALQPLEAETARAFWGMYSASANSAGETQDGPERQVAKANVAPASFFGEAMPKRAKNMWADVVSYENLFAAFRKVRKGKRFHPAILKMYYALDDTLFHIRERLIAKTWTPAPYREFWVQERKPRLINAPAAPDRVVHWALMLQAAPVFERRFIADSYACREGKGAHIASQRAREYIRAASHKWGNPYILKADISKYFPSIDQAVLMRRVERISPSCGSSMPLSVTGIRGTALVFRSVR